MINFLLSTDSCCDELKNSLELKNIQYIPLAYIYNGEPKSDNFTTLDEYENFFCEQRSGKMFSTAGLNPFEVEEYLTGLLQKHKKDVIHFTLSSGLSLTYSVVEQVAAQLNAKSDSSKINVVDSKLATQGQRLLLSQAMKCRDKGMTAQETVDYILKIQKKVVGKFFVSDLDYLKSGGRINLLQATLGKMLQLKPLIEFRSDGKLYVFDKVLGCRKAIRFLADLAIKNYDKDCNEAIYIAHTDNTDAVLELKCLLEDNIKDVEVITGYIGPVIGAHTGPWALGIFFISK